MNNKKLLRALSLADSNFIEEARPKKKLSFSSGFKKIKPALRSVFPLPRKVKYGLIAACACGIIGLNLWLFMPFNSYNISKYNDSEYFKVISALNNYKSRHIIYNNNFEKLIHKHKKTILSTGGYYNSVQENVLSGQYVEITDNQVNGVTEADIIKRSDKHIYYYNSYEKRLEVYSIDKENSRLLGSIELSKTVNDFYLSEDCTAVITVSQADSDTSIELIDVTQPTEMSVKKKATVSGRLDSSRVNNGILYVTTVFSANTDDFSCESKYIPQITVDEKTRGIPAENIYCPDEISTSTYTVIYSFDVNTLNETDSQAVLSYNKLSLVSKENMFLLNEYRDDFGVICTDIMRIYYKDGFFEQKNTFTVSGFITNQYSLDEYNGVLRAVTSDIGSANLYCFDMENSELLGSVLAFSPVGEEVTSVRFDGNSAYVCTADVIQNEDPVFFFDLSNLSNITYKDTGIIEGYSTSLVDFKEGYLLGIGQGDSRDILKLEVYEETENAVTSVCIFQKENVYFPDEYKAYYIDRESGLIGFGYKDRKTSPDQEKKKEYYILLQFKDGKLNLVEQISMGESTFDNYHEMRSFYSDGYLYVVSPAGINVIKVNLQ